MLICLCFLLATQAKLCASIRWLVCKAYSSSTIPPDIRTPFFKDKEVRLSTSSPEHCFMSTSSLDWSLVLFLRTYDFIGFHCTRCFYWIKVQWSKFSISVLWLVRGDIRQLHFQSSAYESRWKVIMDGDWPRLEATLEPPSATIDVQATLPVSVFISFDVCCISILICVWCVFLSTITVWTELFFFEQKMLKKFPLCETKPPGKFVCTVYLAIHDTLDHLCWIG